MFFFQEEFNKLASAATAEGFRLEIHAIGDAAADLALNGMEYAGVSPEKRPILTHCQVCSFKNELLISTINIMP